MDAVMETLSDYLKPEIIWFVIGIVLLLMELTAPGLVVFFFGIGACIVAVTCLIFDQLGISGQLIIFMVSSVLLLVFLRTWLKGIFYGHVTDQQNTLKDFNEYIGQKAMVIQKIDPKIGGKIDFHGANWKAEAEVEIAEGAAVEIVSVDNLTLKVKAL